MVAFLLATSFLFAQDNYNNGQIQTLFSRNKSNGFYGAFSMGYSQIDGKDALISGGRVAFIFDKSLAIGLGGYGFVNNLDYYTYLDNRPPDYTLAGGYGGIFIEPIIGGKKAVHLSFPVLFGIGGVAMFEDYNMHNWDYYPLNDIDNDVFLVLEPAVELELNLTRWFRTAAYASYRYTSKIEMVNTHEDVLEGLNLGLVFKFGKF